MPIVHCAPVWARVRPWLSAVAAGALLLVAVVGPVTAHQPTSHELAASDRPARLREAGVAPRLARTSTTIHFWVTFRDPSGAAPSWVRVLIDGHPRPMTATGGPGNYRLGVRFAYAATLTMGRHRIQFRAIAARGTVLATSGGSVRITGRPSSGRASGGNAGDTASSSATDGRPASDPTVVPDPTSPAAAAEPAGETSRPDDPTGPDDPAGFGARFPDPDRAAFPVGADDGADALAGAPGATGQPTASAGPAAPIGSIASDPHGPGGPNSGSAGGAAPRGLELLGVGQSLFDQVYRAYPVMITTSGTALVWAGFVIFGRRRRYGEPAVPDPVLAAGAATGPAPVPFTELVPPEPPAWPVPPGVDPTEAACRAGVGHRSSRLARRIRSGRASTATSLTFADGAVEPSAGMERRRIRYRLVRLLDVPDELRADRDRDPRRGRRGPATRDARDVPARPLPGRPTGLAPQDGPRGHGQPTPREPVELAPGRDRRGRPGGLHRDPRRRAPEREPEARQIAGQKAAPSALAAQDEDVLVGDVRDERVRVAVRPQPGPGLVPDEVALRDEPDALARAPRGRLP